MDQIIAKAASHAAEIYRAQEIDELWSATARFASTLTGRKISIAECKKKLGAHYTFPRLLPQLRRTQPTAEAKKIVRQLQMSNFIYSHTNKLRDAGKER